MIFIYKTFLHIHKTYSLKDLVNQDFFSYLIVMTPSSSSQCFQTAFLFFFLLFSFFPHLFQRLSSLAEFSVQPIQRIIRVLKLSLRGQDNAENTRMEEISVEIFNMARLHRNFRGHHIFLPLNISLLILYLVILIFVSPF